MLHAMLAPHRVLALTWPEVLVGGAASEFDAEGRLTAERYQTQVRDLMARLHELM
jgi:hypothetical protein